MTLVLRETGNLKGPLLIFLHGGGAGSWMWEKQIEAFSDFHCILPTLQGHGERGGEAAFSIRANSLELLDWLEHNRQGREVHLIGFSIGAQICLDLISLEPFAFQTVILNSASVIPTKWAIPFIAPTIKMTYPLIKVPAFAKAQAKQLHLDGEFFDMYYAESLKIQKQTLIDMLKENMSFALPMNIESCTANMFVTVGEKENSLIKKSAYLIRKNYPQCRQVLIQDIGHGFPTAKPDEFNQLIREWLLK